MRENVLEKLFAGEELEVRIVDPALAHPLIGQAVDVLEQQQSDHEAGRDTRPAVVAVERRDLAVDPVPIDPAGEQNQLVSHVDDLVQPGPEQIVRACRPVLLWSHRSLRCSTESRFAAAGKSKIEIAGFWAVKPQSPAISNAAATGKQTLNQVLGGLFTDNW
ncbi:hypothetical protein ACVIWV_008717 [Bradyrhizobium diazoefficiens]|uniref:Uncharacterized protein n=1 Tax=Bradyrhizobium diazoefficiens TaxID=1355477 RepID=A0A0E4BMP5_9BRAD|nr:hypothetical protein NK6_2891 [Bradyrhizobium diazoefficiens]